MYVLEVEHVVFDREDAEDYLVRMRGLSDWIDQFIALEEEANASGCLSSWFVLSPLVYLVEETLPYYCERHDLVENLAGQLELALGIDEAEREALLAEAEWISCNIVIPAYERLLAALEGWVDSAPRTIGQAVCPAFESAYRGWLATVTSLTAEEIHELATAEALDLKQQIRDLAAENGLPQDGPIVNVANALYAGCVDLELEDAIVEYERLVDEAEARCHDLFLAMPGIKPDVILRPDRLGEVGGAHFVWQVIGEEICAFVAFSYYENSECAFVSRDLAYHEAYPGHHLQRATAVELDLPWFRQFYDDSFCQEGWAAYAESLAMEQGWYDGGLCGTTDYLYSQMFSAALAALDTGVFALGWDRREAEQFLRTIYGGPLGEYTMIDRVLARPGELLSYWLGHYTFMTLRTSAEDAIGDSFDLREFHDVVLRNGVLPLPVLEDVVEAYIEEALTD